jgi:hypothetical protein
MCPNLELAEYRHRSVDQRGYCKYPTHQTLMAAIPLAACKCGGLRGCAAFVFQSMDLDLVHLTIFHGCAVIPHMVPEALQTVE